MKQITATTPMKAGKTVCSASPAAAAAETIGVTGTRPWAKTGGCILRKLIAMSARKPKPTAVPPTQQAKSTHQAQRWSMISPVAWPSAMTPMPSIPQEDSAAGARSSASSCGRRASRQPNPPRSTTATTQASTSTGQAITGSPWA